MVTPHGHTRGANVRRTGNGTHVPLGHSLRLYRTASKTARNAFIGQERTLALGHVHCKYRHVSIQDNRGKEKEAISLVLCCSRFNSETLQVEHTTQHCVCHSAPQRMWSWHVFPMRKPQDKCKAAVLSLSRERVLATHKERNDSSRTPTRV